MTRRLDLAVIGGGPVGLATAIAARLAGLEVAVFESRPGPPLGPPLDKACGEGVMPDGAERLASLGVRLPEGAGFRFRGIRWLDGEVEVVGDFPAAPGLGIRRTALSAALAERAREVGVELSWGTEVRGLLPQGLATARGPVEARWVAAADGLHSRARRWADLEAGRHRSGRRRAERPARHHHRFGIRRHYRITPWGDRVEVHWGERCEAYVTPVAPGEVGVAMLWSGGPARFDALLDRFPALSARLAGAPVASRDRGAGPLRQPVRGVVHGHVALVGDAAGYLDAVTGEGLALGLQQGRALVAALCRGDLSHYARAHRRLGRVPSLLTGLLLFAEARPRLRRRLLRALAAEPAIFGRLLALHVRQPAPAGMGWRPVVRLGWGVLAGGDS